MRRWTISLGIIITSLGFIFFQLHAFTQDSSLSDWNEGINGYIKSVQQQSQNNKPIAAFFYTDWCSNCKRLREDILSQTAFKKFSNENLIMLKINPESGPLENKLAEEFGVFGYPSFFIIPPNSTEVRQIRKTSHIPVANFIQQINSAIKS